MLAPSPSSKGNAPDISHLLSAVQPHLSALNEYLQEQAEAFEPDVRDLVHYCMRHTGKQIRPMLVFYSGWNDQTVQPELVKAAAILELVHQATLVHDDVLDGATIRHNSPTLNEKYDAHTAVLLGDTLFSHALVLASEFPSGAVCRAVAQATRRVCAGEIAQTFQHRQPTVTLEDYYRVIELKTAELFRVSCELGASLSGQSEAFTQAAATFGRHLGIAYQIFDDLADLTGSEAQIGKTLGTDLESGKFTLPMLLLLERLPEQTRQDMLRELNAGNPELANWLNLMEMHQISEAVESAFLNEVQQAESAIEPFSGQVTVEHLRGLCEFIRAQARQLG